MKDLLKEAYDAGNENSYSPASISDVDEQFEIWYEDNKHRVNNEEVLAEKYYCKCCIPEKELLPNCDVLCMKCIRFIQ